MSVFGCFWWMVSWMVHHQCIINTDHQDKVLTACERLLQHASTIKQSVDLAGASIAIDDCYELWESGFISIPYDFDISELQPQLQKLLAAGSARAAAAEEGAATAAAGEEVQEEVVVMEGAEFDMEREDGFIAAASRREGGCGCVSVFFDTCCYT